MTNYISKLKWAWEAQFLSHILVILKNNVFFEDTQMILLPLFDTSTDFRFTKKLCKSTIQTLRYPRLEMPDFKGALGRLFLTNLVSSLPIWSHYTAKIGWSSQG